MTWIAIVALAVIAFGIGFLISGEGRRVWTLLASALVFALAGYAWQGSPDLAASPKQAEREVMPTSDAMIDARRAFYNVEGIPPSRYVVIADGFSRRGQHADAAGMLRNGVSENPEDGEAWLALALALAEHSHGQVTPPVGYAFDRARRASQGNPAPYYFRGIIAMRSGALGEAREYWAQGLAEADENAKGREFVTQQLERLDGVIGVLGERAPQIAPQAPARP
ncbi:tetratricopeptide repeat protein [Alteriqipengyuania sp.]|uniref:tetratricopeptide repeat protein n=1 Tax=Alteriqipengyuania sp. TaxID=2800692 RepID=UPI003515E3A1